MIRLTKQEKKKRKYEVQREKRKVQKKKSNMRKRQERAEFLSSLTDPERTSFIQAEKEGKKAKESELNRAMHEGIPILLDMSYTSFMDEIERSSLITQLTQAVGFLKKCPKQYFRLVCINASSDMQELLKSRGSKKWMIEITDQDIEKYTENKEPIILSPDSVSVLDDVNNGQVYVVGGLVDRTRKKALSLNRAKEKGIKACRLPIEEENVVNKKPILNINTVIEILQRKAQGDSWREAFLGSIPKRLLRCEKTAGDVKEIQEKILIEKDQEIICHQNMIVEGLEGCENIVGDPKDLHENIVIIEAHDVICGHDIISNDLENCGNIVVNPKDGKEDVVIEEVQEIIDEEDKIHDQ